MELEDVTKEQLINAVRKVVADRGPDYVYGLPDALVSAGCTYGNHEDDPGITTERCVFGQAFHELGVPYDPAWEGRGVSILLSDGLGGLLEDAKVVQMEQDAGKPYSEILENTVFEEVQRLNLIHDETGSRLNDVVITGTDRYVNAPGFTFHAPLADYLKKGWRIAE